MQGTVLIHREMYSIEVKRIYINNILYYVIDI